VGVGSLSLSGEAEVGLGRGFERVGRVGFSGISQAVEPVVGVFSFCFCGFGGAEKSRSGIGRGGTALEGNPAGKGSTTVTVVVVVVIVWASALTGITEAR
jgi:hypothetical protein